jgi:hypothetical protein
MNEARVLISSCPICVTYSLGSLPVTPAEAPTAEELEWHSRPAFVMTVPGTFHHLLTWRLRRRFSEGVRGGGLKPASARRLFATALAIEWSFVASSPSPKLGIHVDTAWITLTYLTVIGGRSWLLGRTLERRPAS